MHQCSPQLISGPDEYLNPSNPYSYAQSLFRIRQSEEQHELLNRELARHLLTAEFNMMVSWRQKFLLFTLLAFIVLASDASRLPGAYWEQMLPKKLPTPSSSPSKGTNSVSRSYSTTIKSDSDLSSTDGKV
ncbi:hypothetical protein OIU76_001824 [Salix suchowensis]|nr:hypothetical protein OIU78_022093 [Salix suchowensis]KAJ6352671.1 hypothetical protein OIU76_001824 [Salix suchowensis]